MTIFKAFWLTVATALVLGMAGLTYTTRMTDVAAWWAAIQVARLNCGLVSINDFDWQVLTDRSGSYGERALRDLQAHGATDDIRIAADYVLDRHSAPCANCNVPLDMKHFKPVARALEMKRELRPGQVLPHEFVIATANTLQTCERNQPTCVLRMQDFNGDGQDEVYTEVTRSSEGPGSPEDETRVINIYAKDKDGWWKYPLRVLLVDFDARTYPQRPFMVEPDRTDVVRIDGTDFHFDNYPDFRRPAFGPAKTMHALAAEMQPLGAHLDAIPVVFPQGGRLPDGLGRAMAAGQIDFARRVANPLPPGASSPYPVAVEPARAHPSPCRQVETCRAIVADLDHDGHDEVILLSNGPSSERFVPGDGTLFKNGRWQDLACRRQYQAMPGTGP